MLVNNFKMAVACSGFSFRVHLINQHTSTMHINIIYKSTHLTIKCIHVISAYYIDITMDNAIEVRVGD